MRTLHNLQKLLERRKELRNDATPEGKILWRHLKSNQLGFKFRRQHGIGGYIVDFYCPSKRLIIELDGAHHFESEGIGYDKTRDAFLKELDMKILRFNNSEVKKDIKAVINKIIEGMS